MPGASKREKGRSEEVEEIEEEQEEVIHWGLKGKTPQVPQPVVDKWKREITKQSTCFKMLSSVPFFHRMADLRFYTTESQDGKVNRGPLPLDFELYTEVSADMMKRRRDPAKTFAERIDEIYLARGGRFSPKPQVTMTERAYVMGYLPPDLAVVFHYVVNRSTDLVCVCSNMPYIPLTFDLDSSIMFGRDHPLYGNIHDLTKFITQPKFGYERVPEEIEKLKRVMLIDMRHGRAASHHLYPVVIRCLERANAMLK
jgi:hypothetical protein